MQQKSIVVLDKNRKLKMLIGATAIRLAKEANDPLYEKYVSYREKYLELKNQIIQKYGRKAQQAVIASLKKAASEE